MNSQRSENSLKVVLTVAVVIMMALSLSAAFIVTDDSEENIVILFTNDVHCAVDENIGYAGLMELKENELRKTPNVTLVDNGDAVQGEYIGTVSEGEYIIDIMNYVGYDFAALGNHEFDYGMDQLNSLIDNADAEYLGCNIHYTGEGENRLSEVKPYSIIDYGHAQVAFIGISTPHSITSSTPAYFMENDELVYSFNGESGDFIGTIQNYVDECREKGADYIIAMTHLGDSIDEYTPYSSIELAEYTSGIDVIFDGHAHHNFTEDYENADGNDVIVTSTGTKLEHIGKLVISDSGLKVTKVDSYRKDADTQKYIDGIKEEFEEEMQKVVAVSDIELTGYDEDGNRLVRSRETTIGNFCADAYRELAGSQIAFVNGGGIRADLPAGEITYEDILAVHPYGNTLCMAEVTGQQIIDCLEYACYLTQPITSKDGMWIGENGSFQQVSGVKFTIDTSIKSSVVYDENGMFIKVDGERRVKDVMVEQADGSFAPIDVNDVYTLASHNYLLKEAGGGMTMFEGCNFLIDEGMSDYEILINYLTDYLEGNLSSLYSSTEGRINVI